MTIRIKQQGTTFIYETGPLPGTPVATGGPNGAVQFNDGGLFGGSSSFIFDKTKNVLTVTNVSGSLTRLSDGTSYIISGKNATVVSSSNGSITISAVPSAAFGTAGVDQVQFSDGTNFAASSNFTFHSFSSDLRLSGSFSQGASSIAASGLQAHAEGISTQASGAGSHSEGQSTTTTAAGSHAEGQLTVTSGTYSHAEGRSSIAKGSYSHAEGWQSVSYASYSHAEGVNTITSGSYSHAEGDGTTTLSIGAHSEGYYTIAQGVGSHAEGDQTVAVGMYSHVAGHKTIASGSYQSVIGSYNKRDNSTSIFIVGNGTADDNASRSDVLRVETTGLQVTGSVIVASSLGGALTLQPSSIDSDSILFSFLSSPRTINVGNSSATINLTGDVNVSKSLVVTGDLTTLGTTTSISTTNLEAKDSLVGLGFASGSIPQIAGDRGFIGGQRFANNVAMFWQNSTSEFVVGKTNSLPSAGTVVLTSYSDLHANNFQGSIVSASLGFSGSHTRLLDGTSAFVAGANITITSASNGAVTISSTGGGGSPAGSDTYVQYNNGGSFGASSAFTFDNGSGRLSLTGSLGMKGSIVPDADVTYTLGTSAKRWGHIYTGDLHLRNDRGDWTIVEERDFLCVVNNITGKKYKMMLQPLDD